LNSKLDVAKIMPVSEWFLDGRKYALNIYRNRSPKLRTTLFHDFYQFKRKKYLR